jgi:hypothetical protein
MHRNSNKLRLGNEQYNKRKSALVARIVARIFPFKEFIDFIDVMHEKQGHLYFGYFTFQDASLCVCVCA